MIRQHDWQPFVSNQIIHLQTTVIFSTINNNLFNEESHREINEKEAIDASYNYIIYIITDTS